MRFVSAIALALASALPVVAFACSSSNDAPPPADAGADVADTGAPDLDAGPDIEQPPDTYPAQHAPIPELDYLGGPVLDHMKLATVTFYHAVPADGGAPDAALDDAGMAHVPDTLRQTLRSFDDFIVKSDWWHQTMTGFKVSDGSGGLYGELDDKKVANQTITDDDIQQLIKDGITGGQLPKPDAQTLYAMYFPASTKITNFGSAACAVFLGYHYEVDDAVVDGTPMPVAYAVLPRCGAGSAIDTLQQLTITASHEFAEAASDPLPGSNGGYRLTTNDAWVPPLGLGSAGNENGDVCIFAPPYDETGWKVQAIWSNKAASESREPCQPQPVNASTTYFNAAVRTDKQRVGGHDSFGYLMIPKGGSQDAIIDFFSTAPLAHDARLFVGVDKGTGDPTDMKEVPNGITAALSRSEAHNGNGLVMSVSVPANAVTGDWRFVVRSVLEKDDFHDWPVIVRVK